MPGTYPRSSNPYLHPRKRRRYWKNIRYLRSLSRSLGRSMAMRVILQAWRGEGPGFHESRSGGGHLTPQSLELDRTAVVGRPANLVEAHGERDEMRHLNVGHIWADGSVEAFGNFGANVYFPPGLPNTARNLDQQGKKIRWDDFRQDDSRLDWLTVGGNVPGMQAIASLMELTKSDSKRLTKRFRRDMDQDLARNGLDIREW